MNANLPPQMPAIKGWLADAATKLSNAGIPSANLDSEIILAHVFNKERTFLHAHPDQLIDNNSLKIADLLLQKRLSRIPIAYIIGKKEFYGRDFIVTPATLIPRPESENIISILKQILPSAIYNSTPTNLVDIGTGSGCLGITAKLEFPKLDVTLADISSDALIIATQNAKKLSAKVTIVESDLLTNCRTNIDVIVANLPYVDREWDRSPETDYEPLLALFANDGGLSIIKILLDQASQKLSQNGLLIIESDQRQHQNVIEYAKKYSLKQIQTLGYAIAFCNMGSDGCTYKQ